MQAIRPERKHRVEGRDTAVTVTSSSNTAPIAATIEAAPADDLFDIRLFLHRTFSPKDVKKEKNSGRIWQKDQTLTAEYTERST
jgi:hypothetical protein